MYTSFKESIAHTFLEIADALETGSFTKNPRIALTAIGSEHGELNLLNAAVSAANKNVDVLYIGTLKSEALTSIYADNEKDSHSIMQSLLSSGEADAAVTMHYPFPIGVSTVGRSIAPASGRDLFIAATTGTSSINRVEALVKNAIYGIITAKSCGFSNPSVGILNIDGAIGAESALRKLRDNGYAISLSQSARKDAASLLRGNDILLGTTDIIVCDSLTGNILTKMLAAFSGGGIYETSGFGYGPGIAEGFDKQILIVSRASGSPVISNAILFAAELVRANLPSIAANEFKSAYNAGLSNILSSLKSKVAPPAADGSPKPPKSEPVTSEITGIEVMDIEDAVNALWICGIYAESGMGCTGPLVMVNEKNIIAARDILLEKGFISD